MVSVSNYKKIQAYKQINDDVLALASIVSEVHGYSFEKIDKIKPLRFLKLVNRIVSKIDKRYLFGLFDFKIQTDATKITLGQFVDLNYYLKNIDVNIDSVVARLLINSNLKKFEKHKAKINKSNIRRIKYKVEFFINNYNTLLLKNKDLFDSQGGEDIEDETPHPFITNFGWLYAIESIAEYYRCNLEAVYDLNINEAFAALNYLKAKQAFEKTLIK